MHSLGRALRKGKMFQEDNSMPALLSSFITRKIQSGNHAEANPFLLQSHISETGAWRWCELHTVCFGCGVSQKMKANFLLQTSSAGRELWGCSVFVRFESRQSKSFLG